MILSLNNNKASKLTQTLSKIECSYYVVTIALFSFIDPKVLEMMRKGMLHPFHFENNTNGMIGKLYALSMTHIDDSNITAAIFNGTYASLTHSLEIT